jgi:restriction system protein
MRPLLAHADTQAAPFRLQAAVPAVQAALGVQHGEMNLMIPSGLRSTFYDRLSWAKTYLVKAGLLLNPTRGLVAISPEGRQFLRTHTGEIKRKDLMRYESFRAFQTRTKMDAADSAHEDANGDDEQGLLPNQTPDEMLETVLRAQRQNLERELLDAILAQDSSFFEQLVVKLLVKMGYGGSFREAASVIGRSGDGGIDGLIKADILGFDSVYVQAKRYAEDSRVGRPAIQAFAGALLGHGAQKGVFITTSDFSKEARDYADTLRNQKVVLINGSLLTHYMIEFNLGVSIRDTYHVKALDSDFFELL